MTSAETQQADARRQHYGERDDSQQRESERRSDSVAIAADEVSRASRGQSMYSIMAIDWNDFIGICGLCGFTHRDGELEWANMRMQAHMITAHEMEM